jgi:hypothetical protein
VPHSLFRFFMRPDSLYPRNLMPTKLKLSTDLWAVLLSLALALLVKLNLIHSVTW